MKKPCPGCGELKYANYIDKRLRGTAKCHGCLWKRKAEIERVRNIHLKKQRRMLKQLE